MMTTTSLTPHTNELQEISGLPTESALQRTAPFLARLVEDPAFVESEIIPLLQEAQGAKDWYVARRYDGEDGAYSLKVFVWPAGTETKIHDHSSWGVYRCVWGSVLEERYERLDDDSVADHARLKKSWQLFLEPGGRSLHGPARRRGHPSGRQPGQEHSDLYAPLRTADRRGGWQGLRPLP